MSFAYLWDDLIDRRNRKLQASDWTQMPDSPLSDTKKAEWATYRQALRDVPAKWASDVDKDAVNPFDGTKDPVFPAKPT